MQRVIVKEYSCLSIFFSCCKKKKPKYKDVNDLENLEDIDNEQLESEFMKQLNREKLAVKRWKTIIFRV